MDFTENIDTNIQTQCVNIRVLKQQYPVSCCLSYWIFINYFMMILNVLLRPVIQCAQKLEVLENQIALGLSPVKSKFF